MKADAEKIVWQLRDLLEALYDAANVHDLADKQNKLDRLTKAIKELDASGISVPEDLQQKRTDLLKEVGPAKEAELTLGYLRDELASLSGRLGKPGNGGRRRPSGSSPAQEQPTTPGKRLRELIIETLHELGGSARAGVVLDRMASKLDGQLTSRDVETRKSGELVWRNNAMWVRDKMVKEGVLKAHSPRGIWQLASAR